MVGFRIPTTTTYLGYTAWGIALTAQYSSYSKLDEADSLFNSAISKDSNNTDAYTGHALMHLKEAYGDIIKAESIGFHHLGQVNIIEKLHQNTFRVSWVGNSIRGTMKALRWFHARR